MFVNAPISMYSYVKFPKATQISKIVAVIELSPERFCDFFQNVPSSFYTGVYFEKMSLLFLRFFKNFASLLLNSPNSLLLWTSIYSFYSILQVSFKPNVCLKFEKLQNGPLSYLFNCFSTSSRTMLNLFREKILHNYF